MAEKDTTSGPVILWLNYGYEGWQPRSFASVKEALEADRWGNEFLITRLVQWEVREHEASQ